MFGSLLAVTLLVVSFTVTSGAQAMNPGYSEQDRRDRRCNVSGNIYTHDEIFTIPGDSHCLRYRCVNGGYGIYEEGCDHRGICHPVGSSFDDACRTYTCTKTSQNGYSFYQPVRTRTRCQDYYGVCHDSGSQFHFAINGRLYHQCTCTAHHDGYVSYSCWG